MEWLKLFYFIVIIEDSRCNFYLKTFHARATHYSAFYTVDYKFVEFPKYLTSVNVKTELVKWLHITDICPKIGNISVAFEYGTFPFFKNDEKYTINSNSIHRYIMNNITMKNPSYIRKMISPKPGYWIFGFILNSHSDDVLGRLCSSNLLVTITGKIRKPDKLLVLEDIGYEMRWNYSTMSDYLIELIPFNQLTADSQLSIRCKSSTSKSCFISYTLDGSIPTKDNAIELLTNQKLKILSPPIIYRHHPTILILISTNYKNHVNIVLLHEKFVDHSSRTFELLPELNQHRLNHLFTFMYSRNNSKRFLINMNNPSISLVIPFYVHPIKDQGGVLIMKMIDSFYENKNDSNIQVCIGDREFITYLSISSKYSGYGVCIDQSSSDKVKNLQIIYPKSGWLYIMFNSSNKNGTILVELFSSGSCFNSCSNRGNCRLTALDVGLVYSCSCQQSDTIFEKQYEGLICADLKNDEELLNLLDRYYATILRRFFLIFSNLTLIIAAFCAFHRKLTVLFVAYLFTGISSGLHHLYSSTGGFDIDNHTTTSLLFKRELGILDHVGAIISMWLACIQLANLPQNYLDFFNIIGLLVAFILGLFLDTRSYYFYVGHLLLALLILFISWIRISIKKKLFFPPIDWFLLTFLPGVFIVIIAFIMMRLSNKYSDDYCLYHSLWHVLIGISLCVLMPQPIRWRRFLNQPNFTTYHNSNLNNSASNQNTHLHSNNPSIKIVDVCKRKYKLLSNYINVQYLKLSTSILNYFVKWSLFRYPSNLINKKS